MSDKKKRPQFAKRTYLNDFKRTASGEYIYSGASFVPVNTDYKRITVVSLLIGIAVTVLTLLSGIIPAAGMKNSPFLLVPYVAEVGLSGSVIWAAVRLMAADRPVKEFIYRGTVLSIPRRCIAAVVACSLSIVGQTVFVLWQGFEDQLLFTLCNYLIKLLCIVLLLVFRGFFLKTEWTHKI